MPPGKAARGVVGDLAVPIVSRPCFFCNVMMTIVPGLKVLECGVCEVSEPAFPLLYVAAQAATSCTYLGDELTYVDHSRVHEPTP